MSSRTYERSRAVKLAWEREQELIREGKGTRDWTIEQQQDILNPDKGRAYDDEGRAFEGQHMKSVNQFPEYASNPDNIQFLTRDEHLAAHKGNWQTPTNWYYDPITSEFIDFAEDEIIPCKVIKLNQSVVPVEIIEETENTPTEDLNLTKEEIIETKTIALHDADPLIAAKKIASELQPDTMFIKKDPRVLRTLKSIGNFIVENPGESLEIAGTVISGLVRIVSTISGGEKTNSPSSNSDADLSQIVSSIKEKVENTQRSSPSGGEVSGHWQRYHTRNGMVWKEKKPYQRGK